MSRTRASAKKAGSRTEREVAEFLADKLDLPVERRARMGSNDCGDISGLAGWVVEVKDASSFRPSEWVKEAEREASTATRITGRSHRPLVVAKRQRKQVYQAYAIVSLSDMAYLLACDRYVSLMREAE